MRIEEELHLTYCTNIHPGNQWSEVKSNIEKYGPELRSRISPDEPFGIGLRLSNVAAEELLEDNNLQAFRKYLDQEKLYVFTLNGFPYGSFHRERVKEDVHSPDWRTDERGDYTIRLVHILSDLLPADVTEGSISTSPLSYKHWVDKDDQKVWDLCLNQLVRVVRELIKIRENTGQLIHIDLEPEPDGLLEDSLEVVSFFQDHLLVKGVEMLSDAMNLKTEDAREYLLDHIQVCLDTCHMAIEYEAPGPFVERLRDVGIKIGKIQISSALKVPLSKAGKSSEAQTLIKEALLPFAGSTYLHQVIQKNKDDSLKRYSDLPVALDNLKNNIDQVQEWRVHFHVPVFVESYTSFLSTQKEIIDTLALHQGQPFCTHFEIETYTWEVLPDGLKDDLTNLITQEFKWVQNTWSQLKVSEKP